MNGGGVKGLLNEDEGEDGKDAGEIDPEEAQMVEGQFNEIYTNDPKLREVLGGDPSALSVKEKY